MVNEIIKQINLLNLKLTQEDRTQYLVFKNQAGVPICLVGDFSPDGLMLLVSSPVLKAQSDYQVNLNTWHGLQINSFDKTARNLLAALGKQD